MLDPRVLWGKWRSDPTDLEGVRAFGDVSLEFTPTGQLIHTIHSRRKDQLSLLTYRVDGDWIITDQPSAPREERTRAVVTADGKLAIDFGGSRARYVRVGAPPGLDPAAAH